jgi:hypothetical protein
MLCAASNAQPALTTFPQPDCTISFVEFVPAQPFGEFYTFSEPGGTTTGILNPGPPPFWAPVTTGGKAFDNRTPGCNTWLIVGSLGKSPLQAETITVQSAPDAGGTPGLWGTFTGQAVSVGANPFTLSNLGTNLTEFTGFNPWVRLTLSTIMAGVNGGMVSGALYGWRRPNLPTNQCNISPSSAGGPYTAGQSVSVQFSQAGCSASTWSSTGLSGSGLSIDSSSGLLSGTAVAGNYSVTISYSTASVSFPLMVNPAPSITITSLPGGTVGVPYATQLHTTGGTGAITFAVTTGSLPNGLTLGTLSGIISGTPTVANTFNFSVTPTDSNGISGSPRALSIVVTSNCNITPTSAGPYTATQVISQTFTANSCLSSTWGATGLGGSGLSINASTGVLSGTAVAGSYSVTISYSTASNPFTLTINAAPSITTSSLPGGTVGTAYSQTLATSGGTGTVGCNLSSGSLPTGLSLSSCIISGTPTAAGTFSFQVTPTDANSVMGAPRSLSIVIAGSITLVAHTINGQVTGNNFVIAPSSGTVDATGGTLIVGCAGADVLNSGFMGDSSMNTYTPTTLYTVGAFVMQCFYSLHPTVTNAMYFTLQAPAGIVQANLAVEVFSVISTGFDSTAGVKQANTTFSATARPGSLTPTHNGELIISFVMDGFANWPVSINSGFTISDQIAYSSGNFVGGAMAYFVQATAAAINPTWTFSSSASEIGALQWSFIP